MSEFRIYAATTGDCIAGDRWEYPDEERARIKSDFSSGVRLVVDEHRGEIRGFVPAYREVDEAFYAVLSTKDEPPDTDAFADAVWNLFEQTEGWSIRTGTSEGRLLTTLARDTDNDEAPLISIESLTEETVRVGTPDVEVAGRQLRAVRTTLSDDRPRQYVISLSRSASHLSADLFVHVNKSYQNVTVLED